MKSKRLKRLASLLLCLCMVTSLTPATALAVDTIHGNVSAKIYTGQGSYGEFTGETSSFSVDQSGLILDLRNFNAALPSGSEIESIAFYPEPADPNDSWGSVFWFNGSEEYPCTNGTPNDKLTDNGVFQILGFTPNGSNGSADLMPGTYKVLVYVGNGQPGDAYKELYYLSNETFTITGAMGPGEPVISTATLPDAYVGEEYSQTLSATPGTTGNTLTWAVTQGSLPDGLTLNENSGTISGTPTAAGTSTFTVQVTETAEGETLTATQELTLKVTKKLEITNETTNFTLNRAEQVNIPLEATLDNVTWKIISGTLPSGLYLQSGAITGTVASYAASGSCQVTVQASADGQTATKDFTFQIGDLFRFNLPADDIDSDAMDRYVYLRAKKGNRDITLWSGRLTEDTTSLMVGGGFAGTEVTDVRLITYAGSSSSTETELAEYTGSTSLTLTDGQSADLTGKGQDVLVKLPEITHSYGEDAYIQTWFQESGVSYKTYQPGTIVAASTTFTLHASAGCSGADDPLAEYDLTTATFRGNGVNGTTYTPASNPNAEAITVSYPKYDLTTITVTLEPTTGDPPDLSYAKLSFSQRFDRWTYSADAVVGADNTCQVQLYAGVEGQVTMTNAGNYALSSNTIAAGSINGNSITLTVYGAEERSMAVLVTGKLGNHDADFAAYAAELGGSASLRAETGGKSWSTSYLYLSTLLKGSTRVGLWNSTYSSYLSALIKNGGTLKLSYMGSGPLLESSAEIEWTKDSLTGTVELPIGLRGGVLFDLDYKGQNSILMKGWWHQTDTDNHDVWVAGQAKTAYTGIYSVNNTVAQYCPGNPGTWDFLLLPSIVNPSGMTWDEALKAYPGMPNKADVEIADNTVVKLDKQELAARDANSLLYLTLPHSTFTGPQQFETTGDTLVFSGHIQLDEGADNKMRVLRLNAAGTDAGGRVSTQISSVVINGKEYPYTKIQLYDEPDSDVANTLVSVQFQTYYQIVFEEPMELPCDITVYGRPMSANSAAVLDMSVLLTDKSSYEPVDRVEVSAPSVSVEMPGTVGDKTFTAYVTIPEGGRVDVYDGVDLAGQASRTGDIKITLSGASDSMITSHDLRFVLYDKEDNEAGAYTQTVLHANGAPTLRSQNLQTSASNGKYWSTHQRDHIYTFTSSNPPQFRMTCTFDHPENIKDSNVVFAVSFLDGTIRYMDGKADSTKKGTFVTDTITTSSPVIGATVLYEIDWNKVNNIILQSQVVPSDSPTATGYNFDQTIVLNYADFREELPSNIPSQETQWTEAERAAIGRIQDQIEQIYEDNRGSAGYYTIIGDGSEFFYSGRYMIENLNPGVLPEGYTGETTFTRPLTEAQFEGDLGGGEGWTRLTFTEPGETGGVTGWGGAGEGGETGLEIYTTEFTADSGVSGTLTITRTGDGGITETGFATARGTGTSGGTPTALPESGTIDPGETGGSGDWFSFTNFEGPTDMEVFTNFCDDTAASAGITGSLLEIAGASGGEGVWKWLNGAGNLLGAGKSLYDGVSNDMSLRELRSSTMSLLNSPCAQKLSSNVRSNLQSQLNRFDQMAAEAMAWNSVVTLGGTGTGLASAAGIMSNPFTALTAGIGLFGAGKINRQQISNVRMEAQLARDNVQFQITKYAISSGDTDCAPKPRSNRNAGSSGSSTYRVCIDPSGIVYEAVLSNPVEGATVTLYTADGTYVPQYKKDGDFEVYVDDQGNPATPENVYQGQGNLTPPNADDLDPSELVLTTGPDGRYQWMVPAGLWYVTAEKGEDGYQPGSSNNDVAAVVQKNNFNWLPVLPAQLDVNIPLVSYDIPAVTDVQYRSDSVYLTFSKYMDETSLKEVGAFKINDREVNSNDVELLNSEQAPDNINYNGGDAPSYTSQVKLKANNLSGQVTVTISSAVQSYAGVPCTTKTEGMTLSGTVADKTPVAAPTFTPDGGKVPYGSTVTITCETDGAVLYYTTDGSDPTTSSTRYYEGQSIAIDRNMTIRVLAVKPGYTDATASASFTVPADTDVSIGSGDDDPGTGPGTTPGGGGGSVTYAVSVPEAPAGGTLTVSPQQAARGTVVTITAIPDQGYALDGLTVTDSNGKEVTLTPAGNNQYTFTMPDSGVEIQASFKPAGIANPFLDVQAGDYYYDAVLWAVAKGVTAGTTSTTFSPDMAVTRAQMVTFLWRAQGSPKVAGSNPFADVNQDAYYYDAVLWAVANGVTVGTTDTTFSPDAPVTRAQAVTFQWRAAGSPKATGESFMDVAADAYYADAVTWAVAGGITVGTGQGNFSPDVVVSRAQAVTFLYRELV